MTLKKNKDSFHQAGGFSPFSYKLLIALFPFCLILDIDMNVVSCGSKINEIWRGKELIYNHPVTNYFRLRRPKGIAFTWKNVSNFIIIYFNTTEPGRTKLYIFTLEHLNCIKKSLN